jgi:dipeptidase D
MGMEIERINGVAEALQAKVRAEYNEPDALIYADNVDALGGNALSTQDTDKIIGLLCGAPNGIQAMCADMPGLVQTSLNMGVAKLDKEQFDMTFSVRSSVNGEKLELLDRLEKLAGMYEAKYESRGHYPAWEYKADSVLRDVMVDEYKKMFGADPAVVSIHAGLECGLLGEKIQGLDAVSIGPEMHDIHTSRERLGIASTARMWEFIKAVLKAL